MKTEQEIIEKGWYLNDCLPTVFNDEHHEYYKGWLDCMEWVLGLREEFTEPTINITIEPVLTKKGLEKLGVDNLKIMDKILEYTDKDGNLLY